MFIYGKDSYFLHDCLICITFAPKTIHINLKINEQKKTQDDVGLRILCQNVTLKTCELSFEVLTPAFFGYNSWLSIFTESKA